VPVAGHATSVVRELRRPAMGSDAHVLVVADSDRADALVAGASARIEQLEGRWSRFRDDSEISELNRRAGAPVSLSSDTLVLVAHAVAAAALTGGRFDPTVGGALVALGYDRDFGDVARRAGAAAANGATSPSPGVDDIEIDPDGMTARLPAGVCFDPGGIGKGLAADLVVSDLIDAGAVGALVNLGGDLRVEGDPGRPGGWPISLPDPLHPDRELARFSLPRGAVATSSDRRRRWRTAAGEVHHLVDPATGRPAGGGTIAVTVVADRAWLAEVFATALFVGGPDGGDGDAGLHTLVVRADGSCRTSPGLEAVLP
jgi:thiamine biosynthesis lipoprotein